MVGISLGIRWGPKDYNSKQHSFVLFEGVLKYRLSAPLSVRGCALRCVVGYGRTDVPNLGRGSDGWLVDDGQEPTEWSGMEWDGEGLEIWGTGRRHKRWEKMQKCPARVGRGSRDLFKLASAFFPPVPALSALPPSGGSDFSRSAGST